MNVRTILRATWEGGLDVGSEQFQGMRDVFASLGIGKIAVEAEQAADAPGDYLMTGRRLPDGLGRVQGGGVSG